MVRTIGTEEILKEEKVIRRFSLTVEDKRRFIAGSAWHDRLAGRGEIITCHKMLPLSGPWFLLSSKVILWTFMRRPGLLHKLFLTDLLFSVKKIRHQGFPQLGTKKQRKNNLGNLTTLFYNSSNIKPQEMLRFYTHWTWKQAYYLKTPAFTHL